MNAFKQRYFFIPSPFLLKPGKGHVRPLPHASPIPQDQEATIRKAFFPVRMPWRIPRMASPAVTAKPIVARTETPNATQSALTIGLVLLSIPKDYLSRKPLKECENP